MAESNYIPAGSASIREERKNRAIESKRYESRMREETDEARERLSETMAKLGTLGIELVQFEIVRPLGRIASLAHLLDPFDNRSIIRADTMRYDGRHLAERRALLVPCQGYLLPPDADRARVLQKALLEDGTTGTVMRWGKCKVPFGAYFGSMPPSEAYWCDNSGNTKFLPHDADDHLEPRKCQPVWGESLKTLEDHSDPDSIQALTGQVEAMAVLFQAQQVVDGSTLESE